MLIQSFVDFDRQVLAWYRASDRALWICSKGFSMLIGCLIAVHAERMTGEPPPLMEGEGRDFRILGFNHRQRSIFVNVLMR